MAEDTKKVAAVYVGWTTFKNALDQLSQGLPHFINKDVFEKQSWGVQAQLMSALKFLGLIGVGGVPTPSLIALAVPDEEERKKELEKIIRERYADLFALDLSRVTPSQLLQQINAVYGNGGDTRDKAMRFFLGALGYLGIPVSRFVKVPKTGGGNGGTPRKRRKGNKAKQEKVDEPLTTTPPARGAGTTKAIKLETPDALLTLSVTSDFGSLRSADRSFVFGLMNQLDEYEQKMASSIPSGQSRTDTGGE
jgi:hypothetical protein